MTLTGADVCIGEFYHVCRDARKYEEKFFEYLRMSIKTFDLVLDTVKSNICKQETNFRLPISAEERLVITVR